MEYTELLERQITGRLKVDNPWWTEGVTSEYYRQMSNLNATFCSGIII